jgi:hypothetical protein
MPMEGLTTALARSIGLNKQNKIAFGKVDIWLKSLHLRAYK